MPPSSVAPVAVQQDRVSVDGSGAVRIVRGEPEIVVEEVRLALGQAGALAHSLSGLVGVVEGGP